MKVCDNDVTLPPVKCSKEELLQLGQQILQKIGVPETDAFIVADSLVQSEVWGHPSHGMLRLPWYVKRIENKVVQAKTDAELVVDTGPLMLMDGKNGIGQVLNHRAAELAIERARKHGIAAIAIQNSNHFGTAMYYTLKIAEAGCVAFLSTNSSPAMAPWGGTQKAVGANPWSIAAPAGKYGNAMMDISNSSVARGKIYHAAQEGHPIPVDWATDSTGIPTTDPAEALKGLILPIGGHKGYAMSFMFDMLSGVLSGSKFGTDVQGPYVPDRLSGSGQFLFVVDIQALQPVPEFEARMEDGPDPRKVDTVG